MKTLLSIFLLLCAGCASAITLQWDFPTNYADGTALPANEIAGFDVAAGTNIVRIGNTNTYTFTLLKGTWVFKARTVSIFEDSTGALAVSDWSDSVTGRVWGVPGKPIKLRLP
jgi:hypothetical protein